MLSFKYIYMQFKSLHSCVTVTCIRQNLCSTLKGTLGSPTRVNHYLDVIIFTTFIITVILTFFLKIERSVQIKKFFFKYFI